MRPLAAIVPLIAGLTCVSAHAGPPLPSGGQFVAGSGSISGGGRSMTIDQTSTHGVIDWNSFSIGNGGKVTFANGTGATLNRVTGHDPSVILGQLNATGSVYVINPQGVVVGPGGVVSTGGRFLASALDVDNGAFMAGKLLTFSGDGKGAVINLGKIGSTGGDVVLISRTAVVNAGRIDAPKGTAELATGNDVLLQDASGSQQVFVQTGSKGVIANAGAIRAAQVSLQAADGNIFALAGNSAAIRATGTAERDGHVWLVADKGTVHANGTIAAANKDGSGGTVETIGNAVDVGGANIKAGNWKLGATDLGIDGKTASAVERSLDNGTSVEAQATGANSDLAVKSDIQWKGDASLTLDAGHSVNIARGATIANKKGSGDLTLRADVNGADNGGGIVNKGTVDWSKSKGMVNALYDMNGMYTPGTVLSNMAWTAQPYSGQVSQITAYQLVNNANDLAKVSANLSGNYALGKDISVGAINPVGTDETTPFTGQFDGFGHALTNVNVSDNFYNGLFGVIGKGGVVRDLSVAGVSSGSGPGIFAILAAENYGTVAYVSTSGSAGNSYYGGSNAGLVARNYGLIERSSSSASAGYQGSSGGLVTENYGTIAQSFSTGGASGSSRGSAGALAEYNDGLITQSYSTAAAGSAIDAGSLVGSNGPDGVIDQSFAVGASRIAQPPIDGQTGGIAAINEGKINSNVYWNKDTTQQSAAVSTNTGSAPPASNGLTTAQMSQTSSFNGWDFGKNGVWALPPGATHPVLQWQQVQQ